MASTTPKLGYLCLSENPTGETGRALIRQFVLVREAERMGYDDIWLGECHADNTWPHAGAMALLGYLAAVTSKSRIGSMALMPALRDAVQLAEDVATLDLLSKGRFELGVASGSAFPATLKAHGLTRTEAHARMRSTLQAVQDQLGQTDFVPRPAQAAVPISIATDDETTLRHAAQQGWGLMAAATHSPARIARAVDIYKDASGGRAPSLTLARFACTSASRDEALAIAQPYFDTLVTRSVAEGWGSDREQSIARNASALIEDSLIGSHKEVAAQFKDMATRFGATRIAIIPTCAQFDTHKHILADFVDEVRPLYDDE
jgi:alkanesulfonate monooxygenase SsuD/methylene tetrahydromethanopterin reductase-like flavin-dependent oxidoreductase (luciferase family)